MIKEMKYWICLKNDKISNWKNKTKRNEKKKLSSKKAISKSRENGNENKQCSKGVTERKFHRKQANNGRNQHKRSILSLWLVSRFLMCLCVCRCFFLLLFYALFICFKNGFSMNCLSVLCLCMYLAYLTASFALSLICSFHRICLRFSFISSFISKLVSIAFVVTWKLVAHVKEIHAMYHHSFFILFNEPFESFLFRTSFSLFAITAM